MGSIRYWYRDGQLIELQSSGQSLSSIFFNYGQGLHQSWRTSGTRIPFFHEQFDLLDNLLEFYQIPKNSNFDSEFLRKEIKRLLTHNRVFKGALVHLIFTGEKTKLTKPGSHLHMMVELIDDERFKMNTRGLKIDRFSESLKDVQLFSTLNSIPNPLQNKWKQEPSKQNCDATFFTNNDGRIIDSPEGSLFVVHGDLLLTPSLEIGSSQRAIRSVILKHATTVGLRINETQNLKSEHLDNADEIFLANDQAGIRWIVGYGKKRYFRKYSELFNNIINREWSEAD